MRTEQFQYVLALFRTGSISKAAKKFYMSRPNLSNSIRSLEEELGFDILERGVNGVKFTEKGLAFVRHCMSVVKELDEIQALAGETSRLQFGVAKPNYPPVENAFIRLCQAAEKNDGLSQYRLVMQREYQYEGMALLNQRKTDLVITVSTDLQTPALAREMRERNLEYRQLCDLPCCVRLSRNHPLARDPDFSLGKLRDYPYVDYGIKSERASPYNRIPHVRFINLERIIKVDSGHMRTRLEAETQAYGVGVALPPELTEQQGLCSIPIPNFTMELGIIRRAGEPESALENRFMALLREELRFLEPEAPE